MTVIKELIASCDAYSTETWGGPFDKLPDPAFGYQQVRQKMEMEAARIAEARNRLMAAVTEKGLPPGIRNQMDQYYRSRQAEFEQAAGSIGDPETRSIRMKAENERLRQELLSGKK